MGKVQRFQPRLIIGLVLPVLLMGCGGAGTAPASPPSMSQAPVAATQDIVLNAEEGSPTKVDISWAMTNAPGTKYRIYRDGQLISTAPEEDGKAFDTSLQPGSEHCYQASAIDAAGAAVAGSNKSCVTTAPLAGWNIQLIGQAPPLSLALDSQGRERMSFCGSSGVYFQAKQADGGIATAYLDPGATCFSASLVVGSDGSDHIVYADTGSDQLKYATDVSGVWTVISIPGSAGAEFPSVAIDDGDAIHVAYEVFTGQSGDCYQLEYASNSSGSWQTGLVDSVLAYPSIAVDAAGTPHIAYLGAARADGSYPVHYRSLVGGGWSDEIAASSQDPKTLLALAVTPAGDARMVFKSQAELEYVEETSGSWVTTQVDGFDAAGPEDDQCGAYDVSIDLDAAGKPHLAYQDTGGNLKYASQSSGAWGSVYVDTEGSQNQIRVDAAGHAHITYGSAQNLYSKLAVSP